MAFKSRRTLCTTRDAAQAFGVTMARIRQMASAGQLWCDRIGDTLVYDADEVHAKATALQEARAAGHVRGPAPKGFQPDAPASHVRGLKKTAKKKS